MTLITRPRRFGKTLNMDMVRCFFSNEYEGRADLFEGLSIWEDEKYHMLQGNYPVLFLSFAEAKGDSCERIMEGINGIITDLFTSHRHILEGKMFVEADKSMFESINDGMSPSLAARSIHRMCGWLYKYYGKNPIVLIDEYDTPMQEAWLCGCWDEISSFFRTFFNSTLKTNPHLERALLTGITRVVKESIFSDLNNLNVVSVTSDKYATSFGFTEYEVFAVMDSQGIDPSEKELVKRWYEGYVIGGKSDIYNPWSVTCYLQKRKIGAHWGETSSNALVGKLLREGDRRIKEEFELLLSGESIEVPMDEYVVFPRLGSNREGIYSLLLATGYLKAEKVQIFTDGRRKPLYTLSITNLEVSYMFFNLISDWFLDSDVPFGEFVSSMIIGDVQGMNVYMNKVALETFSSFDAAKVPSEEKNPERFYHGFVLGLLVDKAEDYTVKSNRESGYGRYDVVMEPKSFIRS